ncbi:hypothetical protein WJX75_007335 [Coccomyxa subellipsoidea]|uniref:Uncharacterized protein n=1 Tax=Coccomyxa subellipsoidea TaxID=248742 RepID=A0ABR2YWK3_9CHLO
MSRSLRGLAQTASRALINTQRASGHQQQRFAGDLPVKSNKSASSCEELSWCHWAERTGREETCYVSQGTS